MTETFSMYLDFALTKLICVFTFSSDFLGDFLVNETMLDME